MHRLTLLPLVSGLVVSIACGSTSTSTSVGPSPVRCGVTVAANPATFPATGGRGSLVVSAARECAWNASTQAGWISLGNPREGQGDGSVAYTVSPNPAARTRRGTLVVGGQTAEVTQQAAPCSFEVSRRTVDVAAAGGVEDVNVSAPDGCSWTATASAAWTTILEGAQGNGNGRVRVQVAANTDPAARSATLQVAGIRVTVRQASGTGAPPPPPGSGECTYAVDPQDADVNADETDGSFSVQTDVGCPWTAASDASWLTILDGSSGSGAGEVRYRAASNSSSSSRTGRIDVNGAIFTLTQAGELVPDCRYDIDPGSASFPAAGGTGRIDVDTDGPCPWSASTSASWIDVTSGGSGIGDGRVTYQVEENTSTTSRSETIAVAGRTFTVTQEGAPEPSIVTVTGRVRNLAGSCPERTFRVDGRNIRTTDGTDYDGGSCGDLSGDESVSVTGILGSDGVVTATEVRF